jgi:mycofactocin system creatininase family protein
MTRPQPAGVPELAAMTSPEIGTRTHAILAVPVGATEQHGPHLPMSTDTDIAVALCRNLAETRPDVLVAPALPYGSSGEHAGFAGTLSIGQAATELVLLELARSATDTFRRVLFVSTHGGNVEPVRRAADRLRAESRDVSVFQPRGRGDLHAGRTETSLQLTLRPGAVRMNDAVRGDVRSMRELWPILRAGGVRAVTRTGVLGDPTGASASEGRALLEELSTELIEHVADWLSGGTP